MVSSHPPPVAEAAHGISVSHEGAFVSTSFGCFYKNHVSSIDKNFAQLDHQVRTRGFQGSRNCAMGTGQEIHLVSTTAANGRLPFGPGPPGARAGKPCARDPP